MIDAQPSGSGVDDIAEAKRSALCRVDVAVTTAAATRNYVVWIGSEQATATSDSTDEPAVVLGPPFATAALARILGLGPRAHSDPGTNTAPGPFPGSARELQVSVTWDDAGGNPTGRTLTMLDTGTALHLDDAASEGEHSWTATTTTQVWRLLQRLLPDDDELGRHEAGA
ncbi:MAG: hypothetical protein ACT4P1_06735 [Sporichthyaceae bacterium]